MFSLARRYLFSLPIVIYAVLRKIICSFRKMSVRIDGATKVADVGCATEFLPFSSEFV